MEKKTFQNGDFVLHKIPTLAGASKLSAWYDRDGNLKDCEALDKLGRTYKPAQVDRQYCNRLGNFWKTMEDS